MIKQEVKVIAFHYLEYMLMTLSAQSSLPTQVPWSGSSRKLVAIFCSGTLRTDSDNIFPGRSRIFVCKVCPGFSREEWRRVCCTGLSL